MDRVLIEGYEADPDLREIKVQKSNYSRTGETFQIRWHKGVFVTQEGSTGAHSDIAQTAKAERVFLHILDQMTAQARYVSASPGPTYAPSQFAKHPDAEGCTKRAFVSAMEALFKRGDIHNTTHGRASKQRTHIARRSHDDSQD